MVGTLRRLFEEEAKASRRLEKASRDCGCTGVRYDRVVKRRRRIFVKACQEWELAKASVEADPEAMEVLSGTCRQFGVVDGFVHLDDAAFRASLMSRITEMEGGEE